MSPVLTGTLVHPDWMLMVPDTRHIQSGGPGAGSMTHGDQETLSNVSVAATLSVVMSAVFLKGRIKKQDEVV